MNAKNLKSILENPANASSVRIEEAIYRQVMDALLNAASEQRSFITFNLFKFPSAVQRRLEQEGFKVTLESWNKGEEGGSYKVSF